MSGPPPPPPGAPPPPPCLFAAPKLASTANNNNNDNRGALLNSIRQGAKLKKTITVDKSAPMIAGKIGNNQSTSQGLRNGVPNPTTNGGIPQLGGLFAQGMPKLKPTGRLGLSVNSSSTNSLNNTDKKCVSPMKNFSSIQDQLKKQLYNPTDTKNRGPPPPAPTRAVIPEETTKLGKAPNANGMRLNSANVSSLHNNNNSTLHRKAKSNANLSHLDSTSDNGKSVINHGKPNLAPKPPILNGKPCIPPTKVGKSISRAQSMRTPRSPSPQQQSPTGNVDNLAGLKFGTVRNISSLLGQSIPNLNSSSSSNRPRIPLTGRPSAPPPSIPPPPPSTLQCHIQKNAIKPPSHAPPPPPGSLQSPSNVQSSPAPPILPPQAPSHAPPPPPPHKTTQPSRPSPAVPTNNANNNNNNPPPPPPRHSSMRDVSTNQILSNRNHRLNQSADFEDRFKTNFNLPEKFPRPALFRNVLKIYSNRQVSSKQQAPLPPQMHLTTPINKGWNSANNTC